MSKIAIFASGAGSNALKIIEHFKGKPDVAKVDCLITNKEKAGVYDVSNACDTPIFMFENSAFSDGKELLVFLKKRGISWLVLAGFLRKVPHVILEAYPNQIINLHPSLLPKYGGKGMYGERVHEAVLKDKESESGISIHLVNEEYDKGKILMQKKCLINEFETVSSLKMKIQQLEHNFFPIAIEEEIIQQTNKR